METDHSIVDMANDLASENAAISKSRIMNSSLGQTIEILSSTPDVLRALLSGSMGRAASDQNSADLWEPFDVVGHLIHGEETDWIPRARIILEQGSERTFVPFDRFAQFERSKGKTLANLLDEFETRRGASLETLRSWNLSTEQLCLTGIHPELGEVTLSQLLTTWAVHDLNHIRQIVTAIVRPYEMEVGPWKEYLSILK